MSVSLFKNYTEESVIIVLIKTANIDRMAFRGSRAFQAFTSWIKRPRGLVRWHKTLVLRGSCTRLAEVEDKVHGALYIYLIGRVFLSFFLPSLAGRDHSIGLLWALGLVPVSLRVNKEKESEDPHASAAVHFGEHPPFAIRTTKLELNDTRIN